MTSSEASSAMTCREIETELKKRDLSTDGLKGDLINRLCEAEKADLIETASTTDDSEGVEAVPEAEPAKRRSRRAWKLLCLAILCASLFVASWHSWRIILNRISIPFGIDHGALTPQDLTWLNYPDHYAVLDVPPYASSDDIKRAYRQKAKKWHPDKATRMKINPEILSKATRILGHSRDILLDPKDRRRYDKGSNPVKCDSSCELCTCRRGVGARSSSGSSSSHLDRLTGDVLIQGAKTGADFVLKMTVYGVMYSYRIPQCWIWHWDLPLWDKRRCTEYPLDPMWSEARSIQERCEMECEDRKNAIKDYREWLKVDCQKTCKREDREDAWPWM